METEDVICSADMEGSTSKDSSICENNSSGTYSSFHGFGDGSCLEKDKGGSSTESHKSYSLRKRETRIKSTVFKREEARKILKPKKSTSADPYLISSTNYGRLVWAKIPGSRSWPGVIISHEACGTKAPLENKVWIFWFGDNRVSEVDITKVWDFGKSYISESKTFSVNSQHISGVIECLKECRQRAKLTETLSKRSLLEWAYTTFSESEDAWKKYLPKDDMPLSVKIEQRLKRIKKTQLRECASSNKISSSSTSLESSLSSDGAEAIRKMEEKGLLLNKVRDGARDIETVCIACDQVDCEISIPHPYFKGGVCEKCKEDVEESTYAIGADGLCLYCAVCGSPGEILLCDHPSCDKVFCTGCVELLVSQDAVDAIHKMDPWYCFLCNPYDISTHGLIQPRPDWVQKTMGLNIEMHEEDETPDISFPRRPIRVLSLFDGVATGLHVLDELEIEVEMYSASEVNESAINVAESNFGSRITWVGDVVNLTDKQISELCPIDLLIGGSPCNDLSYVNPLRKGLFDPSGTGILFFHFYRALKVIEAKNCGNHLFWLYENVMNMPREFKKHISLFLQKRPVLIDAKHFSAQNRPRCFWGNIPGMYNPIPPHVLKKNYCLSHYLNKIRQREALVEKINCITTNPASLKLGSNTEWPISMNDHGDVPWITEIEKIFGFPVHYTDDGRATLRERLALLGRSWSVPVIKHILQPLTKYYSLKEESEIGNLEGLSVNNIVNRPPQNNVACQITQKKGHENKETCKKIKGKKTVKKATTERSNKLIKNKFKRPIQESSTPPEIRDNSLGNSKIRKKNKFHKVLRKTRYSKKLRNSSDNLAKNYSAKFQGMASSKESVNFSGFEDAQKACTESSSDHLFIPAHREKRPDILLSATPLPGIIPTPCFVSVDLIEIGDDYDADISSEYNDCDPLGDL